MKLFAIHPRPREEAEREKERENGPRYQYMVLQFASNQAKTYNFSNFSFVNITFAWSHTGMCR